MTVKGIKSISTLIWSEFSFDNIKSEIDKAKIMGLNAIRLVIRYNYPIKYRTSSTDPIKEALPYAQSQGISVVFVFDIDEYPPNGRETFYNRSIDQQRFLDDVKWIVDRYPQVMIYEIEEPHRYSTDATTAPVVRAAMNQFFLKLRAIIPSNKALGFNLASLYKSNHLLQGFDVDFVNSQNIFTFYAPQLAKNDLSAFKSAYQSSKNEFPNLEIYPCSYVSYSGLQKLPPCTTSLSYPVCWNQEFFNELKWLKSQNIPFIIFRYGWMDLKSSVYFPTDTTPGDTVKDKILYILGTSTPPPCPIPICGFTIKET